MQPPQLDYNVGKEVISFKHSEDGGWTLKFEDGVVVECSAPDSQSDPTGFVLMAVYETETQWLMNFGTLNDPEHFQVELDKGAFTIDGKDPEVIKENTTPPDPSAERVYESAPESEEA